MNEFAKKWWTKSSINRLLKKLKETSAQSMAHSVRPQTAHTEENVNLVNDLVLLQTHRIVRKILIISWNVMKLPP